MLHVKHTHVPKMETLFEFPQPLKLAVVVARPSKTVKTPYVADIMFADDPTIYQAHAPSLGCSGLVDVDSNVYVSGKPPKTEKDAAKTTHTIYGTTVYGGWRVGVNPMIANKVVRRIIEAGLDRDNFKDIASIDQEVTIGDSRVDIRLKHGDGSVSWVEVKNVPLAHYRNAVEGCKDYRAAAVPAAVPGQLSDKQAEKIALFPDGYRKNKADAISPRATKHLENLMERVAAGDRAYCVFLCQRTDAVRFEPAALDTIYSETIKRAVAAGVNILCYAVEWSRDFKTLVFKDRLPVYVPQ
jgi:DNA-binding sugar fermentation-stimulating protein